MILTRLLLCLSLCNVRRTKQLLTALLRLQFDSAPEAGPAGRYALIDQVIGERPLMNAYHGAFPGLGKVGSDGTGVQYRWYGANYASMSGVLTTCEGK